MNGIYVALLNHHTVTTVWNGPEIPGQSIDTTVRNLIVNGVVVNDGIYVTAEPSVSDLAIRFWQVQVDRTHPRVEEFDIELAMGVMGNVTPTNVTHWPPKGGI